MIGQNDDRRIRHLIETAAHASANGRVQEADRLVRQAEANLQDAPEAGAGPANHLVGRRISPTFATP